MNLRRFARMLGVIPGIARTLVSSRARDEWTEKQLSLLQERAGCTREEAIDLWAAFSRSRGRDPASGGGSEYYRARPPAEGGE